MMGGSPSSSLGYMYAELVCYTGARRSVLYMFDLEGKHACGSMWTKSNNYENIDKIKL